jgi:hypothetical protein
MKKSKQPDFKYYDYRFKCEEEGEIYQLVLDKASRNLSNEDLFNRLYDLSMLIVKN